MRKPRRTFRRRFSARRPVTWFAPRTGEGFLDASISCWADAEFSLHPVGGGAPELLSSPIVWNLQQAMSPGELLEPGGQAHPFTEGWTMLRVRGQIGLEFGLRQNDQAFDGFFSTVVHMGIIAREVLGDTVVDPQPFTNDTCLDQWCWLHHEYLSCAHFNAFKDTDDDTETACTLTGTIGSDAVNISETCFSNISGVLTDAEVFGVPSLKMIDVDVKSKRRIRTETTLSLVVACEVGSPTVAEHTELVVRPWLRALLSRTV